MKASTGPVHKRRRRPKCLDVKSWHLPTKQEILAYLDSLRAAIESKDSKGAEKKKRSKPSALAARQQLSPLDVYCYLRARFGEPNGFQNFLRTDDSDNWIHWEFHLKAGNEHIHLCGTSREVHLTITEPMADGDWRDLILAIKADYSRVGEAKTAVLKSLERWAIFPNKFVEIAAICADLHADIVENIGGRQPYESMFTGRGAVSKRRNAVNQIIKRSQHLYRSCIELSLLTPVLAEAFINMAILILCKRDVRDNPRQFDAFIRSQIDTKVFDLFCKCEGFARPIDRNADSFKNFKRVMDKRNNTIHGNADPDRERIELVYFERTRPLFPEPGDNIGKHFEALERQHQPATVLKDYEDVHMFFAEVINSLEPQFVKSFRRKVEDPYPGYEIDRKIVGCLFPEHVVVGHLAGVKYDDELAVVWGSKNARKND